VDPAAVRAKSGALTGFFLECVAALVPPGAAVPVTPAEPERRGSQVSLRCERAREVSAALTARGVVGDHRPPDLLRLGFAPLYTRFVDAERAARVLAAVLAEVAA
jgi:kynureninase